MSSDPECQSAMHRGPDSLVWTDGYKSYDWLDMDPAFKHRGVVHAKGEFSKVSGREVRECSDHSKPNLVAQVLV